MVFVRTRPFPRKIRKRHRAMQATHDVLHVTLDLARALGDRLGDTGHGIHQHMLKMSKHARRRVLEALARLAGNRGTDAGKIIVTWCHTGGDAIGTQKRKIVGFNQHLEECIVPTHADALLRRAGHALADALVQRGNIAKSRFDVSRRLQRRIALRDEMHEPGRCDARRHCIVRSGDDRRQRGGARAPRNLNQ